MEVSGSVNNFAKGGNVALMQKYREEGFYGKEKAVFSFTAAI